MLLVYYRLYITYTLAGFYLIWIRRQRLQGYSIDRILNTVRQCVPIPQKIYNITKRIQTQEEVEKYFPGLLAFTDSTEQQIHQDLYIKIEEKCTIRAKRKDILLRISLWLITMAI